MIQSDLAESLLDKIVRGHLKIATTIDVFRLGQLSVQARSNDTARTIVELLVAGEITVEDIEGGAALEGIEAIIFLQGLDGVTETPKTAFAKWREMSEIARQLLGQKYEFEANRPGGALNPRREPSARDLQRLAEGESALALPEATTAAEAREQLATLHLAACAMQSLDDLGTDVANLKAARELDRLIEKHERAKRLL